jgi:hypothetical protein
VDTFVHAKTREVRMRIRTKRLAVQPYFMWLHSVRVLGARPAAPPPAPVTVFGSVNNRTGHAREKAEEWLREWDESFRRFGQLQEMEQEAKQLREDRVPREERVREIKAEWQEAFDSEGKR